MLLETHWSGVIMAEYMFVAASKTTAQTLSPLQLSTKYKQKSPSPHNVNNVKRGNPSMTFLPLWAMT